MQTFNITLLGLLATCQVEQASLVMREVFARHGLVIVYSTRYCNGQVLQIKLFIEPFR